MAISKMFYTNEKLSYIRMGMEILSFLLVGAIWRFCFRKPTSNEAKLQKEVTDLKTQLERLNNPSSTTGKVVAKSQIQDTTNKIATMVRSAPHQLTFQMTTFEQRITTLDAKFAQCEKLFRILYQAITFLYQNVEFKNTNTNNNIIMLNAFFEASKGSQTLQNDLVDTSSSNILKTKNLPQDSFSNASNTSVNTVSINTSMDTSRNLSDSSLLLSPIKKEPSNSSSALVPASTEKSAPLPSSAKMETKEIQATLEDPVATGLK